MAIDTSIKRRMASTFLPIWKAPIPSGTIEAADRAHISWIYGGVILAAAAVLVCVLGPTRFPASRLAISRLPVSRLPLQRKWRCS